MTSQRRAFRMLVTCLLLVVLSLLLYLPSLRAEFLNYDDGRVLIDHPELYNQSRFMDSLKAIFFQYFPREEPLLVRDLSWAADSRLFGFANPAGFHFVNVVLHSVVVMLLFILLMLTTGRYDFSLLTTLAFLLLAVHVEPVTWIMGRKDILVTLFGLLALIAQCRMLLSTQRMVKCVWYFFSLCTVLLALFSKINAVVFPAVLFLHFLFYRHLRNEVAPESPVSWIVAVRHALPCLVPHLITSFLVYKWYHGILKAYGILDRHYSASFPEHLWNVVKIDPIVLWRYVCLMFFPRHLSLFYTWPDPSSAFRWTHILFSIGFVLCLVGIGVFFARRRKDLLFYYLAFFVLMIPYLNVIYFGIWVANRYLYFSSFCIMAIAVNLALDLFHRSARIGKVAIAVLALIFLTGNVYQKLVYQQAWKNSKTLWSYEIRLPDTRIYAFDNLASFYYSAAGVTIDKTEQETLLKKTDNVIEQGFARFWTQRDARPPAKLFHLFFIKALIAQVRGESPSRQWEALRQAYILNPRFDAVLFELAVFSYRQALNTNGEVRKNWAKSSVEYFKEYVQFCFKDPATIKKIQDMKNMYVQDFPSVAEEAKSVINQL